MLIGLKNDYNAVIMRSPYLSRGWSGRFHYGVNCDCSLGREPSGKRTQSFSWDQRVHHPNQQHADGFITFQLSQIKQANIIKEHDFNQINPYSSRVAYSSRIGKISYSNRIVVSTKTVANKKLNPD